MSFVDYSGTSYDVRVTQGDDLAETFTFQNDDGDELELSGYSFLSQLRRTADGPVVAQFSTTVSGGSVTRRLTPSVTSDLEGEYVHDFQWTTPQGVVRTLLSGVVEVEPEVSR